MCFGLANKANFRVNRGAWKFVRGWNKKGYGRNKREGFISAENTNNVDF